MMLAASASLAQSCEDCIQIPRKDFELAKKAADEARESRVLLAKQDREIELLQENSRLKNQVIQAQAEAGQLKDERLAEKDKTIAAERTAREATEKQLAIETKEKLKAQASARGWRKVGTIAGGVAAVLLFGVLH
jgi:hypothetical protein